VARRSADPVVLHASYEGRTLKQWEGFIKVPNKPGLGITLNDEAVKAHLTPGTGFFDPT
jgi:L-alanine-DL-glutamate epimerase-like enolase superfamily enzyme